MSSLEKEGASCAAAADRKRAAVRTLIERYYHQLTKGCGSSCCTNEYCASSGKVQYSAEQAAIIALNLCKEKATLCVPGTASSEMPLLPSQTVKSSGDAMDTSEESEQKQKVPKLNTLNETYPLEINSISPTSSSVTTPGSQVKTGIGSNPSLMSLTEKSLKKIIENCKEVGNFAALIRTLGQVFSIEALLKRSFLRQKTESFITENMTKEDIRSMEVDLDKDEDSVEVEQNPDAAEMLHLKPDEVTVDLPSVRRAFASLFSLPGHPFQRALINALNILFDNLEIELRYNNSVNEMDAHIANVFLIVMEIPMLECPEYFEDVLPKFCKAAALLPLQIQVKLTKVWSKLPPKKLKAMVDTLNQLITLRVISGRFTRDYFVNDEERIIAATKVLKLFFCANIYGGVNDVFTGVEENDAADLNLVFDFLPDQLDHETKEPKQVKEDPLMQELGIRILDSQKPVIPFEEYYNELLSENLEMDRDFAYYRSEGNKFAFMNYAFILTPAVKALGLYYDNRIRMYNERRVSMLQSLLNGGPANPYLRLHIRRDHIIDDALVGLEMVAMEAPSNLKKQLVVEFEGEQGIDEGGVSKEFFQLIVEEIFNPDFGMFTLNNETRTYWFNPTSFESDAQFTLIGIILGLAIYNNIILDVNFPLVVYKKLLGKKGTFKDLCDWNPILAKGLLELMAYEGEDLADVFMQTFRISYQDIFGTVITHDLKENGDQILVTRENRQEFVDLYADFLLNKSIEKQFRPFKRGFLMVTDDSPLKILFRPEEVELLVCGSRNFDFNALEEATEYDGGYTEDSAVIKNFWEIVHELNLEDKQKLLQFTTGSDRVPVGGLSKLKLVIARNGPDSDRLPTAHTCFNVLLLPEYSTKEKLLDRLLKAINYSKGFGML